MEAGIFETVLAFAVLTLLVVLILRFAVKDVKDLFAKKRSAQARLLAKQRQEAVSQPVFRDIQGGVREGYVEKSSIFILEFEELQTEARHAFQVEERVFELVQEQDTGVLVFKGSRFLSFKNVKAGLPAGRRAVSFEFLKSKRK